MGLILMSFLFRDLWNHLTPRNQPGPMDVLQGLDRPVSCGYTLKDQINENTLSGTLVFDRERIDVSVQVYNTFWKARHFIRDLKLLEERGVPHVAKAYTAIRCIVEGKEYGLAFIEPVSPVDLSNLGDDFWRYGEAIRVTEHPKECFGFGNTARKIFSAIGLGMEGINRASITHGNLCNNGVMRGKDGKIRLCNFSYETAKETEDSCPNPRQKIDALIRDLNDFKRLIGNSIQSHPKLYPGASAHNPTGAAPPDDWEMFNYFYENRLQFTHEHRFLMHAKWVYRAPFFWNPIKVGVFFEMLNEIIFDEIRLFGIGRAKFALLTNWQDEVMLYGNADMNSCLDHCLKQSKNHKDNVYNKPHGVIRFARSYRYHHENLYTCQDAFERVLELFPHLTGIAYFGMFTVRDSMLNIKKGKYGANRRKVDEWFWSSPSIFELDESGGWASYVK